MEIGKFLDFYADVTKNGTKIPQEEYCEKGKYPIIDQGQKQIAGKWSESEGLFKDIPAIIFGDHTRAVKYIDEPFFIGADGVKILRPVRAHDNVKYLFYALQAARIPDLGYSRHFKVLKELDIRIYSRERQDEIVRQLEQIDVLDEQCKKELLSMDQLVKSRFVEMFGDPEDSTAKWNRTNFASVCLDMHQGINTVADKIEYVDSGFPILQSKNITSGFLNLEDVRYVKESDYEYYRNKYNPQPNDLLVCNIGTIGKSLIVENEMEFLIAWNLFLIKLNKELVSPIFIKAFIELLNQQNYFEKYMTGGTVKFVNKKTIGNISTPLPPLELQEQFAVFVAEVDKSKLAVKQSLEKLETLKKSLMQQYFGG